MFARLKSSPQRLLFPHLAAFECGQVWLEHMQKPLQHEHSQICSAAEICMVLPQQPLEQGLGTQTHSPQLSGGCCLLAEKEQKASWRTVTLLDALVATQLRERGGNTLFSSIGSKYEQFYYQTELLKVSFQEGWRTPEHSLPSGEREI